MNQTESHKNEYENLKSYFKSLVNITVIFLGIISAIAAILFAYDRSSLQQKTKNLEDSLETKIINLEKSYEEAIEQIKSKANFEIEVITQDVKTQISAEIENEIANQFARKNINTIIDKQLNHLLDTEFSSELKQKMASYLLESNESLNELTDISDAAIFMRVGNKRGLNDLIHYSKNAKFSENRARALELKERISIDYKNVFEAETIKALEKNCKCYGIDFNNPKKKALIKTINEINDLERIAIAIELLNRTFKTNFKPFEFELINDWYKQNKEEN